MNNKDLIKKIKQLKQIQPSSEWLDLTRHNLVNQLNEEDDKGLRAFGFFNWLKGLELQPVALALCLLLIFMAGPWLLVKAAQSSLPGETLYSVKKIGEEFQSRIASDNNRTQLQIEFAGRRLEELANVTGNPLSPEEEKSQKAKEIVNELKDNLLGASVYAVKMDKERAITVAKTTKKIKEELGKTKGEAPAELENDLAEAEKAIEEIDNQILAVLTGENQAIAEEEATTTPDEETLIFLEESESGTTTTTEVNHIEK